MLKKLGAELNEDQIETLASLAAGYGLLMRRSANEYFNAPISLLPTLMPKRLTEELISLTSEFNHFMYSISLSVDFLNETLAEVIKFDDFIKRLSVIASKTPISRIFLALNRNDFFLDQDTMTYKQVEFNTMASSFGSLSTIISKFHRHSVKYLSVNGISSDGFIPNKIVNGQAAAIAKAHELYGNKGKVMFLILEDETNFFDQVNLEIELFQTHDIISIRKTLTEVFKEGVKGEENELIVGGEEISVVYFRAGYSPDHYSSEDDWIARELIDTSNAVKTPNIHYHLAGSKKIQQAMNSVESIGKFSEAGEKLIRYFTGLWSLDEELEPALLDKIRNQPEGFVLKPQREGGGNNFYGPDILPFFDNYPNDQLKSYILMQKINSCVNFNSVLRNGQSNVIQTISELGIFGSLVALDGNVVHNQYDGYLLRTKNIDSNEGGVAAGYSVIDSIYLED